MKHPGKGDEKLIELLAHRFPNYSKRQLKEGVNKGGCLVNGKVERFASKSVQSSDQVNFDSRFLEVEKKVSYQSGNILFEDEDLFVYDKPSGINSVGEKSIHHFLEKHHALYPVHRIDKETSGILIFAKTQAMKNELQKAFQNHQVVKTYLALVDGLMQKDQGSIDKPIGKLGFFDGQTLWGIVQEGKSALTLWECVEKGKSWSLLRCYPKTGRTHQIRVHLSSQSHPVLGDYQYGKQFLTVKRPLRLMLHAEQYEVSIKGKRYLFSAPIPEDFNQWVS